MTLTVVETVLMPVGGTVLMSEIAGELHMLAHTVDEFGWSPLAVGLSAMGPLRHSAGDPDANGVNTQITATGWLYFDPERANTSHSELLGQPITIVMEWGGGIDSITFSSGTYESLGINSVAYTSGGAANVHVDVSFTHDPFSGASDDFLTVYDAIADDYYRLCPGVGPFTATAAYDAPIVDFTPAIRSRFNAGASHYG